MKRWLLLFFSLSSETFAIAGTERPNIIFILSDDLNWGDLGCYGQQQIKTPNIDRFANGGIRFTNAYAGNSVCAPSRSCLMQGLHSGHARVRGNSFQNYRHSLQAEDVTVASILQEAGYKTGMFGKWGLGLSSQYGTPNHMGFDEFFGYLNQRKAHNYYPSFLWLNRERVLFPAHEGHDHKQQSTYDATGRVHPAGIHNAEQAQYSFDLIHRQSLDFIRRYRKEPFFLYLAHTIPHGPVIVPELGLYRDQDWAIGHREWAAMITRLDQGIGDILNLLNKLNLEQKTLVFFASDNGHSAHGYNRDKSVATIGSHFQNYGPTRGRKGNSYDGAFRVPTLARWPGKISRGHVSNKVWAFWDFLPTALAVAGLPPVDNTDGISILPTLLGDPTAQKEHQYLYWEFNRNQAIRSGKWFAHRKDGGNVELYNIQQDPQQRENLADQHPELASQILAWMQQSHRPSEVWPSPGESPQMFKRRLKSAGIPVRLRNIDG